LRLRLAAMAGHLRRDKVAARRAALVDLLADGRPHPRAEIWATLEAQVGRDCWGRQRQQALWDDLHVLRAGGLRIAYSRRPAAEGYYLQDPAFSQPRPPRQPRDDPDRLQAIRLMTTAQKNRLAFAAAAFALRQKRLILAEEHPDWSAEEVGLAARQLVFGPGAPR
jgi:hypothetical protein